jgi:hypothetical protein
MSKKINKKNLEKLKQYFAKIDIKTNNSKIRGTGTKSQTS